MVKVTKASGEIVEFSEEKLKLSLSRSGASPELIQNILDKLEPQLYDGIPTKEIYKKAYSLLSRRSLSSAGRYKLKKALMDIGPSGYPFEKFVSKLLQFQGYRTNVGIIVKGKCVDHEIDVIAEKNEELIMIECKFHNRSGMKSDVKVPLYINSRFYDIKHQNNYQIDKKFNQCWVVTNTRFSDDAIQYGNCSGIKMIAWDTPKRGNLRDWISVARFHPITCLSRLKKSEIEALIEHDVILIRDIPHHKKILEKAIIPENRIIEILKEVEEVMAI